MKSPSRTVDLVVVTFNNSFADVQGLADTFLESASALGASGVVHIVANDGVDPGPWRDEIVVHTGQGNVGFARGVGIGVNASRASYCVIANPDCAATSEAMTRFLQHLGPGCGILAPRLVKEDGALDYNAYQNWTFTPGRKYSQWRCRKALPALDEGPFPSYAKAPGTFIGLERSSARLLGPFDDHFLLYAEDRDLKDRAKGLRIPITYLPAIAVVHTGGVSAKSVAPLVAEAKTDGYLRVARRRFGRIGVVIGLFDLAALRALGKLPARPTDAEPLRRRWLHRDEPPRLDVAGSSSAPRTAPLNVVVLWADNQAANLGVRVLAEGSEQLARRAAGEREIVVNWQDYGSGDSTVSFGARSIARDVFSRRGPISTKLAGADLIIDSGAGDSFTDIYGPKRLSTMAYAQWRAARLGRPLILGPQTIGPFNTWWGRLLGRWMVRHADFVAARDDKSAIASAALGRPVDVVSTDLVFSLPTAPPAASFDVLLNVSGLLWFGSDHVNSEKYRAETVALVEDLATRGRAVTLLPHVVGSSKGSDDLDASNELVAMFPAALQPTIVTPTDLHDARSIISGASIVIGARMHACLNALSQGVPSIPWAYSRKFEPLMIALDWPHVVDLRTDESPAARTIAWLTDREPLLQERAKAIPAEAQSSIEGLVASLEDRFPGLGR